MGWRRGLAIVAAVISVPIVALVALFGSVFASFPGNQGPRIDGPDGLVGVDAGRVYAWLVPSGSGVVLVDTGMDPEASAIRAALAGRAVRGVLITHGHLDHIGGVPAFPGVPVWAGADDVPLVRGERRAGGLMQALFSPLMDAPPPPPADLRAVTDGEEVVVDGVAFGAVILPGHTPGSVAWRWGDTVFTGDSLLGHGDHVAPAHWAFADDYSANEHSIAKLRGVPVARIADGHAGLHGDITAQIAAYASAHP